MSMHEHEHRPTSWKLFSFHVFSLFLLSFEASSGDCVFVWGGGGKQLIYTINMFRALDSVVCAWVYQMCAFNSTQVFGSSGEDNWLFRHRVGVSVLIFYNAFLVISQKQKPVFSLCDARHRRNDRRLLAIVCVQKERRRGTLRSGVRRSGSYGWDDLRVNRSYENWHFTILSCSVFFK